jgi:hypothetical protein
MRRSGIVMLCVALIGWVFGASGALAAQNGLTSSTAPVYRRQAGQPFVTCPDDSTSALLEICTAVIVAPGPGRVHAQAPAVTTPTISRSAPTPFLASGSALGRWRGSWSFGRGDRGRDRPGKSQCILRNRASLRMPG